jgi:ABC-type dipeptide/oligopeptide/nickel transport system permease component
VTQALWERAEPTTLLALMAVAIAALIGVPCGIVSAVFRGKWSTSCSPASRCWAPAFRASGSAWC